VWVCSSSDGLKYPCGKASDDCQDRIFLSELTRGVGAACVLPLALLYTRAAPRPNALFPDQVQVFAPENFRIDPLALDRWLRMGEKHSRSLQAFLTMWTRMEERMTSLSKSNASTHGRVGGRSPHREFSLLTISVSVASECRIYGFLVFRRISGLREIWLEEFLVCAARQKLACSGRVCEFETLSRGCFRPSVKRGDVNFAVSPVGRVGCHGKIIDFCYKVNKLSALWISQYLTSTPKLLLSIFLISGRNINGAIDE
jgi:hypothetical protein